MKTFIQRQLRHPKTLEGASLECSIRGEQNYTVAAYRGAEDGGEIPIWFQRGGVDFARAAWTRFQAALLSRGFEIIGTTTTTK